MTANCGHPFPCKPLGDARCDHVDGHGVHRGYVYRCRLVDHHEGRHDHDKRRVTERTALTAIIETWPAIGDRVA